MAAALKTAQSTQVADQTDIDAFMKQTAGQGVSALASDNIVPQVDIMQPLSPRVTDEGLKPGDIVLNNAPDPIVTEFYFQPCATTKSWFRFVPRDSGGGFVDRWAIDKSWPTYPVGHPLAGEPMPPPGAKQKGGSESSKDYSFDNGDNCIFYRHLAGIVWRDTLPMMFVLPFKGSGHSTWKNWNGKMLSPLPSIGGSPACFTAVYRVGSYMRSNKKGKWFDFDVGDRIMLNDPKGREIVGADVLGAMKFGKQLADRFDVGDVVPETPRETSDSF
jgi:hypothetical protein